MEAKVVDMLLGNQAVTGTEVHRAITDAGIKLSAQSVRARLKRARAESLATLITLRTTRKLFRRVELADMKELPLQEAVRMLVALLDKLPKSEQDRLAEGSGVVAGIFEALGKGDE